MTEMPIFDTPIFACKSAQKEGNEHMVGVANEDGKLIVMNCETKEKHGTTAHNNAIFDLAWMFDQMKIVTASGDHTSKLYDVGDGDFREVKMFCGHTRSVKTVTFRKDDSSVFASGSRDGHIVLWDTRTEQNSFIGKVDRIIMNSHAGKEVNTPSKKSKKNNLPNNSGIKSVTGLVFQDTNTLISCGAGDGVIKIWDIRKHYTISKKEPMPKHIIPYVGKTAKNGFSNLLIDNAGIKLYANCLDNTIYCYNIATYNNEPVMKYTGHQNSTFYIKSAINKEGTYLVSGSSDENAYVWNLKYPDPIVRLPGHSAEVTCVAWCNSKPTPSLVTCSDDTSHRIWTIYNEDCSDNIRYKGEVLPLFNVPRRTRKRLSILLTSSEPKRCIWQCKNCQAATITNSLCENCIPVTLKRKADCDLWNESKRIGTEFGPRRLFRHLNRNFKKDEPSELTFEVLERDEEDTINLKSLNTALESFKASTSKEKDLTTSPTVNLPNFVVDGMAPHLNFSPPKRKSQDWLTRMRIERNLRQEMLEKTLGPSSPKMPKLELTPKSSKKTWTTPKSPLLRFFKVTNSNNKSDSISCSPKTHNCNFLSSNSGCEQLSQ